MENTHIPNQLWKLHSIWKPHVFWTPATSTHRLYVPLNIVINLFGFYPNKHASREQNSCGRDRTIFSTAPAAAADYWRTYAMLLTDAYIDPHAGPRCRGDNSLYLVVPVGSAYRSALCRAVLGLSLGNSSKETTEGFSGAVGSGSRSDSPAKPRLKRPYTAFGLHEQA